MGEVNIPGLISIILFYILILGVGLWAARKSKSGSGDAADSEDVMLAGRNIGLVVGIFTMTATWVGGGYINGTAESVFRKDQGLVWCQAPLGYAMSLVIGGLFFAKKMRNAGYVTMLDPFQYKFGERMCGLLFIPALLGEVFWSAAILSALGATLSVIIQMPNSLAIVLSACIALVYTLFGGLYSVAYTDVIQLFCIFIGLWICVPFSMLHKAVTPINETVDRWIGGPIPTEDLIAYLDSFLMLTMGGIPWQVYFQRVLSSKTALRAQVLSYVAGFGCIIMAIPAVLVGAVAASADWNQTTYRLAVNGSIPDDQRRMVLPLVLQYLCHPVVSFIGLGAISAAVMSSADSSILSAASMFARNVVKPVFWQTASENAVLWVMRVSIFIMGGLACIMGIWIPSIYGLWSLCSDLVYVILFPQLICVVFMPSSNTYGSLAGYMVGLLLRITAGESLLGLRPVFQYPGFQEHKLEYYQRFPIRTFSMLLSFASVVSVSLITDTLFRSGVLSPEKDYFHCYRDIPVDEATPLQNTSMTTPAGTVDGASKETVAAAKDKDASNGVKPGGKSEQLGSQEKLNVE